jgi:large subunit ribosomal protein L2
MSLKQYNPITSSQRGLVRVDRRNLWKGKPYKALVSGLMQSGGRNNLGRITVRHKGGGHKRLYRIIDFKRNKCNVVATVQRIEYDPNRSSYIALLRYDDGEYSYILAPEKLQVMDRVVSSSGADVDIKVGNCLLLQYIPIGTSIHSVEMKPGKGGQIGRAAGASVNLIAKDSGYAQIKLSSGEIRLVSLQCSATVGVLGNGEKKNTNIGKAGRNRWLGHRPHVRGVAMNPIDHPHGGGEGKTSGGRHPVTPWGKCTKGKKTRRNKLTSKFILKRRTK